MSEHPEAEFYGENTNLAVLLMVYSFGRIWAQNGNIK